MINNRDTELLKAFGEHLRKLRTDKGLSQEALALKAELSKNQIGNIERGEVNVTLSTLNLIAKTLDLSLQDLLKL